MALNLSGLASGVDTDAIVTQLMAIERQKGTRLKLREGAIQGRDTALKDVRAKLEAVKTAAAALKAPELWAEVQDVTSSDVTRLTGSRTGAITPGIYTLEVQSLAVTEKRSFAFSPQTDASLTLSQAGKPDVLISLPAGGGTVSDAAAAINASADAYATAAVIDGKLVLTSKQSGAAGAFTLTGTSATGSPVAEEIASHKPGADASYTVDGQAKTSPTNAPADAVAGMTLSLKAVTTGAVTLTVGEPRHDVTAVKEKVKAFVEAYNTAISTVQAKTGEKRVQNPTTMSEAGRGQLFGDRGLASIASALRAEVGAIVSGNPAALDQLSELGVSVPRSTGGASSADARLGKLVFDEAKLTSAMEVDPVGVQRLMGGLSGTDGFAQKLTAVLDRHIDTGVVDGVVTKGTLVTRLESTTSETRALRDQMSTLDRRLEAKEKRLRAQFSAMEAALNAAQTQQSWLSGQLAGLNSSR